MRCPKCSCERTSVIDSRSEAASIRRRRECQSCQFRFSTYERLERLLPLVVKKDLRREPFGRDKLRNGLRRACEKRPVSAEQIEEMLDRLESALSEMHEKEIASTAIGDLVMGELRGVDHIAYVRFASVYREFSDVHQFVETLDTLHKSDAEEAALIDSQH
jgi:transcriptional repressor NrdR